MTYYKYERRWVSNNDFSVRTRMCYYKKRNRTWWRCVDNNTKWVPCSDPIRHGMEVEEILEEDVFLDLI